MNNAFIHSGETGGINVGLCRLLCILHFRFQNASVEQVVCQFFYLKMNMNLSSKWF